MRFMKRERNGFAVVDKVCRVKKEEYNRLKRQHVEELRGKTWWVPKHKHFEKVLVLGFSRSNKGLSRPVERYVSGKRKFCVYQFNCTYVVAEWIVGKNLIEIKMHNVDGRFKFAMIAGLMSLNETLERMIHRHIVKQETLWMLSRFWKEFQEGGSGYFSAWVYQQEEMQRLVKYRSTHATRDALWVTA